MYVTLSVHYMFYTFIGVSLSNPHIRCINSKLLHSDGTYITLFVITYKRYGKYMLTQT